MQSISFVFSELAQGLLPVFGNPKLSLWNAGMLPLKHLLLIDVWFVFIRASHTMNYCRSTGQVSRVRGVCQHTMASCVAGRRQCSQCLQSCRRQEALILSDPCTARAQFAARSRSICIVGQAPIEPSVTTEL